MTKSYVIGDWEYKEWPTAVVLASVTQKLLCDPDDLYSFISWMSGVDEDGLQESQTKLAYGISLTSSSLREEVLGQLPGLDLAVKESVHVDEDNKED